MSLKPKKNGFIYWKQTMGLYIENKQWVYILKTNNGFIYWKQTMSVLQYQIGLLFQIIYLMRSVHCLIGIFPDIGTRKG